MKATLTVKQIGYMPSTLEDEKINLIAEVFTMTRVNVIRNLLNSKLTLDRLFERAQELKEERGGDDACNFPHDCFVDDNLLFPYSDRETN